MMQKTSAAEARPEEASVIGRIQRTLAELRAPGLLRRGDVEGIETVRRFHLSTDGPLRKAAIDGMLKRLGASAKGIDDGMAVLAEVAETASGFGMRREETEPLNKLVFEAAKECLKDSLAVSVAKIDSDKWRHRPSHAQLALKLVKSLNLDVYEFTEGIGLTDSETVAFKLYYLKHIYEAPYSGDEVKAWRRW